MFITIEPNPTIKELKTITLPLHMYNLNLNIPMATNYAPPLPYMQLHSTLLQKTNKTWILYVNCCMNNRTHYRKSNSTQLIKYYTWIVVNFLVFIYLQFLTKKKSNNITNYLSSLLSLFLSHYITTDHLTLFSSLSLYGWLQSFGVLKYLYSSPNIN